MKSFWKRGTHQVPLLLNARPSLAYRLVNGLLVFPIFRIVLRGRISGSQWVPRQGPIVVVANHGSYLDPPLLGHALGRPVAFMAKAELFYVPLLGPLIRACGAYPVYRGTGDLNAIRVASQRLADGWATGVFLDGTRQSDGRVHQPLPGAALLSSRYQAPLLPVAIINSHRALGRGRCWPVPVPVHLRIGKPILPPMSCRKSDLRSITHELMSRINALLDQGLITYSEQRPSILP
ncbi:1-acyl-sn-glycerol-3-phosphate acyltransferase [cyanobiont of Ornithocercus magnificus]|nr:1-acyl-sn-glycerol-3-phosphate acyltransferase [cyanobiont of Ornithocercus magnificus]